MIGSCGALGVERLLVGVKSGQPSPDTSAGSVGGVAALPGLAERQALLPLRLRLVTRRTNFVYAG